jgi:hypothetical protein
LVSKLYPSVTDPQFVTYQVLSYTRKNAQVVKTCSRLVAMLFKQLVNRMCSHFALLVPSLLLYKDYKVVELNRLVTSCSINLLSSCNSTICEQVVSDNQGVCIREVFVLERCLY